MFRGTYNGNVDDKGRLKLPASVKRSLQGRYSSADLFVTSIDGKLVKIYPIKEWELVEATLSPTPAGPDQARDGALKHKILFQANRFGTEQTLDAQGRCTLPATLRESADLRGAVKLQWQSNHIIAMTESLYSQAIEDNELTENDLQLAANLGL